MEMIKVVVRMRIEIVVVKRVVNIFIEVSVIIKFIEWYTLYWEMWCRGDEYLRVFNSG